jgi:hypothetical protein
MSNDLLTINGRQWLVHSTHYNTGKCKRQPNSRAIGGVTSSGASR